MKKIVKQDDIVIKKDNTIEQKIFVNFFDTLKYRAIIYNSVGEHIDTVKLDRFAKNFNYKDGLYNINFDHNSGIKIKTFWKRYKYFSYQLGNPDPINYNNVNNISMTSEKYNIIFKTEIAKKLNDINENKLLALLTPRNLVIGLIVIVAIGYFASGGTIQ